MRIIIAAVALALGASCLGIGACKTVPVANSEQHTPDCSHAEKVMLALEQGDAHEIDRAFKLMPCYDGAYAERVDVALGDLITRYPKSILEAMHRHHLDRDMINGIVNTQPWNMVDKPCKFVTELNKRIKAIEEVHGYAHEANISKATITAFIPTVTEMCQKNPGSSTGS